MPKLAPRLTDLACRNARANTNGSPRKLSAGGGMYLFVTPMSKTWRMDYRFLDKRQTITLGTYPATSLRAAETKRDEAQVLLAQQRNPMAERRASVAAANTAAASTFEVVARAWYEQRRTSWTVGTAERAIARLERFLFPYIGSQPIADITPQEVLTPLSKAQKSGVETAYRVLALARQVFAYGIATNRTRFDPTIGMIGALPKRQNKGFATVTDPRRVSQILQITYNYNGTPPVAAALKLAPILFVRPGELRQAEWAEIDLEGAVWRIPATKMKMRIEHVVPLSTQAVAILKDLMPLTQRSRYIFPNERSRERAMSENAVLAALRTLGIPKEELVGHGFRHMATTLLREQGFRDELVDRQLAHKAGGGRALARYDFSKLLPERTAMMQTWSDYLDQLRIGRSGGITPAVTHMGNEGHDGVKALLPN